HLDCTFLFSRVGLDTMNISKLKSKAEGLVTQLTAKDACEKRVLDAIGGHSYAAPRSLLNEIAEDTFSHESYSAVMRLVWKTINSAPRNWRSIAKALILLEHLVKNGAEKVVADVQQHIHDITYLNDFRFTEGNLDRGSGIREKAQDLANLLGNTDRIYAERRKAKDLRSQYGGYGASDPPRFSSSGGGGGGGGGDYSSRDFPADPPRDSYSGGGGMGRSSGEMSDDWRAGYDRSPTPPLVESQRSVGSRSESIDFDEGRQGYSGRLSQYQEQERREASLASQPQSSSRNSGGSGGGKSASSSSKKRIDSSKGAPSNDTKKPTGPDLLSGDDPFPVTAPSRPQNDFSSFGSLAAPQVYQGGMPQQQQQQQQQRQQWAAAAPTQAGQMIPYAQGVPGPQNQQNPMQQGVQNPTQVQVHAQAQAGWGQQPQQGQQLQQHGMQQPRGYGQGQGGQQFGHPQQQMQMRMQPQQQRQMPMQPQQQQMQHHQQQMHIQPQQQQMQHHQQQMHIQPQQQQMYQQYQPQQAYQQQQQPHQQQPQPQGTYQQQLPQQLQQQPQQPFQPQPSLQPQQSQQQLPTQQSLQPPPPAQPEQQQQQPRSVVQAKPQPPPPAQQQQPIQPQALAQQQPQRQQQQQQQKEQMSSSGNSQHQGGATGSTVDGDWVPTEVVRAGIGGIDLAAAVGGLRQTGFKPSDLGGNTVFSGQGQRGSDGRHVSASPLAQQRTEHLAPPQPSVEYVEEEGQDNQEDIVIRAAGTGEFLGARSGLKNTGLSSRLQETPQPVAPPRHLQAAPLAAGAAAASAPVSSGVGVAGAGQWQGLPQQRQQAGGGGGGASWQTRQGGLKPTGLMGSGDGGGGGGVVQQAAAGQAQGQGTVASAPWQQGAAGLRRTGL
ncbi:unnamed protein product, partial [Pylaiella littoralis]